MILACTFLFLFLFFSNETLHHLPSRSKRGIIAVKKKAPYGGEGEARSVPVTMFKTAAANTLCECMNSFQSLSWRSRRRGWNAKRALRALIGLNNLLRIAEMWGKEAASIFISSLRVRYWDGARGRWRQKCKLHARYKAMSSKTNIVRLRDTVC